MMKSIVTSAPPNFPVNIALALLMQMLANLGRFEEALDEGAVAVLLKQMIADLDADVKRLDTEVVQTIYHGFRFKLSAVASSNL
jgi:hypothetical protein